MKYIFKKALSVLITLCLVFTLWPATVYAAAGEPTHVTDEDGLRNAISAAVAGDTISIDDNITLTSGLSIDQSVVLTETDGYSLDAGNYTIVIPSGYEVTFGGNLRVRGNDINSLVEVAGTLTLTEEASVVQAGGGFAILNTGTLTIEQSAYIEGTSVAISNTIEGELSVAGGTIQALGNSAQAAIRNYGTLTVEGGTIGNTTDGYYGIHQPAGGTASINDGTICGQSIAVLVGDTGTLTVSGGTFTLGDNTAAVLYCMGRATLTGGRFNSGRIITYDSGTIHINLSGGGDITLPAAGMFYNEDGYSKEFLTALPDMSSYNILMGQRSIIPLNAEVEFSKDPTTSDQLHASMNDDGTAVNMLPEAVGTYDLVLTAAGTGTASSQSIKLTLPVTVSPAAPVDLTWSPAVGDIAGNISQVTAGANGRLAAINGSSKIIVSADGGQHWTVKPTGNFVPKALAYARNGFIAAGNGIMTSSDGANWTNATVTGAALDWSGRTINALTAANTSKGWVVAAGGNNGLILTAVPNGSGIFSDWFKIYGGGGNEVVFGHPFSYVPEHPAGGNTISEQFVGFGGGSIYTVKPATISAPDFTSVSSNSDTTISSFSKVWYENIVGAIPAGKFFATMPVGYTTVDLYASDNGRTWTKIDSYNTNALNGYASNDSGTSVKVGNGGTILTSTDGSTWNSQTVGAYDINDVIYADGIFVAVGDHGTILASADGVSWNNCTSGTTNDLASVAFAGGTFIASGNGVILRSGEEAPADICKIGTTGYATLGAALTAVNSGETIKLLQNITHTDPIEVNGKTINFDLGDYNLLLDTSTNPLFATALKVEGGGKVNLTGTGTGKFNVKGSFGAVSIIGANSEATVHNVEVTEDDNGVSMVGSGQDLDGGTITVKGNIKAEKGSGVSVNAKNGTVVVNGSITAGRVGVETATNPGTQVTVNGDITVIENTPDNQYEMIGIRAHGGTTVTVTGNVTVRGTDCIGVYAYGGEINVAGNVASDGKGAKAEPNYTGNGKVTITGSLSAGTPFITVGTTELTAAQGSNGPSGSLIYTDGRSVVQIGSVGDSAPTYTITFNLNGGTRTGGGALTQTISSGGSATAPTVTRSNYTFTGWDTGFSNVTQNLTVTAQWSYNGSSESGGKGGSTPPAAPTYKADVTAGSGTDSTLPVTVDKKAGIAGVDVGSGRSLISGGTASVITVPSIPDVNTYTLGIPVPSLSTTGQQGALTFHTDTGSVTVPSNMLTGVAGISGNKAVISIGEGDKTDLPGDVKAAIGDRPLIQLTLSIDGRQTDWNNPEALVTVSIPYKPTAAELANPESIVIWYIDGSGNAASVPNGHYDPVTGTVTFDVTHFSDYAVAYNKVSFSDVAAGAWYNKAVSFIAARDITTGSGGGKFSPDAKLTRGQFLVQLMKAYDIAADGNGSTGAAAGASENFADAGNTYYTGYLAAAKRLGISGGIGGNLFAPDKEITRQEMATLLYNALKSVGQLPQGNHGKPLSAFSDADQVASWAKDAMTVMAETGTITGSGGALAPGATTTRAQFAQVVYNLLSD